MKYACATLGIFAGISLAAYLAVSKAIVALGEAVEGIGDIEQDWDEYDRLREETWDYLHTPPTKEVVEATAEQQRHFDAVMSDYLRKYPKYTQEWPGQ